MSFPHLDRVRRWRDHLRALDPAPCAPLSDAGVRAVWIAALDALHDDALAAVAAIPGTPWRSAGMAVARTAISAPIEWCAVLTGRGTSLVLKHPHDDPGLVPLLVDAARAVGLPLAATPDRTALDRVELVIAMGSDETADRIRAEHPGSAVLAFGHRFSVAWITRPDSLHAVARDAALHDGRGCMSPVAVVTPLPLPLVTAALADAMAAVEAEIPRGRIYPDEAARIRARRALARASGAVHEGPGWSVHALPIAAFEPTALPRTLAVHPLPDVEAFARWLAPWVSVVSTVGTDDPRLHVPGARIARPGEMQRPPLVRLHDGVDWLRATIRTTGP